VPAGGSWEVRWLGNGEAFYEAYVAGIEGFSAAILALRFVQVERWLWMEDQPVLMKLLS